MSESIGYIHPALAPVLTKIAREERPAWDQSRKKQDTAHGKPNVGPDQATATDGGNSGEETASPTHIDLRI